MGYLQSGREHFGGKRCDLQGSQFGHVVEAGNGDVANVVVVQRPVKRKE